MSIYHNVYLFVAITISFNESTYNVDESAELLQSVLVLSNPSSTNITVEVFSIDGSATGQQLSCVELCNS